MYPLRGSDPLDIDCEGAYIAPVFKCSVCGEEYMTRIYPGDDFVAPPYCPKAL